jgi:hypothetical protein
MEVVTVKKESSIAVLENLGTEFKTVGTTVKTIAQSTEGTLVDLICLDLAVLGTVDDLFTIPPPALLMANLAIRPECKLVLDGKTLGGLKPADRGPGVPIPLHNKRFVGVRAVVSIGVEAIARLPLKLVAKDACALNHGSLSNV